MALGNATDSQIDSVLAGHAPDGGDELTVELAAVASAVRAAFVRTPSPEIAERHIAAMVAEADRIARLEGRQFAAAGRHGFDSSPAAAGESAKASVRRPPTRRGRFVSLRLAAVGLAALLAMSGLAIAGVRPPEPIADGLEALGLNVPGDDGAERGAPPAGSDARPPAQDGSASGEASEDGPARQPAREADVGASPDERTPAREPRPSEQGEDASADGQETAAQAQSGTTPPPEPGQSEAHSQGQGPPQDPGGAGAQSTPGLPTAPPGASAETPATASPHGGPALGNPSPPGR
jgi:hypothetical protein